MKLNDFKMEAACMANLGGENAKLREKKLLISLLVSVDGTMLGMALDNSTKITEAAYTHV